MFLFDVSVGAVSLGAVARRVVGELNAKQPGQWRINSPDDLSSTEIFNATAGEVVADFSPTGEENHFQLNHHGRGLIQGGSTFYTIRRNLAFHVAESILDPGYQRDSNSDYYLFFPEPGQYEPIVVGGVVG